MNQYRATPKIAGYPDYLFNAKSDLDAVNKAMKIIKYLTAYKVKKNTTKETYLEAKKCK